MLIWSIAAVVFIACCLILKYATRPVALAYDIGRRIGEVRATRQAHRERHRNCLPEADATLLIRTLGDCVHVLDEHGLLVEAKKPRPDLRLVPYYGQPGSSAPSWNLSPPDGAPRCHYGWRGASACTCLRRITPLVVRSALAAEQAHLASCRWQRLPTGPVHSIAGRGARRGAADQPTPTDPARH